MYSIYDSAVNAHIAEMQYTREYVPFDRWLEAKKRNGFYWGV